MPLGLSKNLFQRIVSAVLLLPPVLGSLWAGGWWFVGFLIVGGVLMAREWASLTDSSSPIAGYLLSALVAALVVWAELMSPEITLLMYSAIAVAVIGAVFVKATPVKGLGWFTTGFAYVGAPIAAMWWLRTLDAGLVVLWVFFIVWATDIGGYFFGKGIGGPKLAPKISPKKTWAGLLGGMAFSIAVGLFLHFVFDFIVSTTVVVIASGALAFWAQVGDLVESGIKRHFDVKDSGELIPGHGGLLDRVDGLVFVAPAMALLFVWLPDVFRVS